MITSEVQAFPNDGPDAVYAAFIDENQFKIQHCSACKKHVFYPRLICPHCGSQDLSWVAASGDGVVYSTSVPRGAKEGDYNIALIDLAEGVRMLSRVVDIAPEEVTIGMQVSAFIGEIDGKRLVLFRPAKGSR